MNSERERLLKQNKRCCTCEHYSKAKYGLSARFPDVAGFCERIKNAKMFLNDYGDVIWTDIENKITTTAGSSCGFWRKK